MRQLLRQHSQVGFFPATEAAAGCVFHTFGSAVVCGAAVADLLYVHCERGSDCDCCSAAQMAPALGPYFAGRKCAAVTTPPKR